VQLDGGRRLVAQQAPLYNDLPISAIKQALSCRDAPASAHARKWRSGWHWPLQFAGKTGHLAFSPTDLYIVSTQRLSHQRLGTALRGAPAATDPCCRERHGKLQPAGRYR
jgi:hypothetical protein